MNKRGQYKKLIEKRKTFNFQPSLINPSTTGFDGPYVEPWAQWHGDLNADIMVIGQEFCDHKTFLKEKGTVEKTPGVYKYPSNANLTMLLKTIGRDPGHPNSPNQDTGLFFTNSVMALKKGSMSANFSDRWINESRINFLEPLIDIIEPRVIICIGTKALLSISRTFGFGRQPLKKQIDLNPVRIGNRSIFAVFHTGGLGLRNRSLGQQVQDWKKIGQFLQ